MTTVFHKLLATLAFGVVCVLRMCCVIAIII